MMPRIFDKVLCIKCPLDEICPWSASEVMLLDKDGLVYAKVDDAWDYETIALANVHCPLKKILESHEKGQTVWA